MCTCLREGPDAWSGDNQRSVASKEQAGIARRASKRRHGGAQMQARRSGKPHARRARRLERRQSEERLEIELVDGAREPRVHALDEAALAGGGRGVCPGGGARGGGG